MEKQGMKANRIFLDESTKLDLSKIDLSKRGRHYNFFREHMYDKFSELHNIEIGLNFVSRNIEIKGFFQFDEEKMLEKLNNFINGCENWLKTTCYKKDHLILIVGKELYLSLRNLYGLKFRDFDFIHVSGCEEDYIGVRLKRNSL